MPNLEDWMNALDDELIRRGYPAMERKTLDEVARRIEHPEVLRGLQSGQITIQKLADEAGEAMRAMGQLPPENMSQFEEGGFINDASGLATARARKNQFRNQLGAP